VNAVRLGGIVPLIGVLTGVAIGRSFGLEEAEEAYRYLDSAAHTGEVTIRVCAGACLDERAGRQCQPLAGGDERTVVYSLVPVSSATAAAVTRRSRFQIGFKTLGECSSWPC
jgi:hypothetical protein